MSGRSGPGRGRCPHQARRPQVEMSQVARTELNRMDGYLRPSTNTADSLAAFSTFTGTPTGAARRRPRGGRFPVASWHPGLRDRTVRMVDSPTRVLMAPVATGPVVTTKCDDSTRSGDVRWLRLVMMTQRPAVDPRPAAGRLVCHRFGYRRPKSARSPDDTGTVLLPRSVGGRGVSGVHHPPCTPLMLGLTAAIPLRPPGHLMVT